MRALLLPSLVVLLAGCGARSGLASLDVVGDAGLDSDIVSDIDVDTDVVVRSDAVVAETSPRCEAVAESLAEKIVPATGACTTVVRVSRASGEITGYDILCGGYAGIDEATARKRSASDTGIGATSCFESPSISGSKPKDDFVFFQPASAAACACCGDGWFTAVSARTAMTVLGGTITFGEGKGLVFPREWSSASDLGVGCTSSIPRVVVRGWDLTKADGPTTAPPALDASAMDAPLRAVWSTALPDAWAKKHYLFDGVVLEYAPNVTNGDTTEWLVMINTGWLE